MLHQRRHIRRRIWYILWRSDLEAPRLMLSWGAILWSIMLFWPGDTFDRPTYTLMAHFADEWVWATAFGVQGVVMMYSLIAGYQSRFTFALDALLGAFLWSVSCWSMLLSVYPPPAAIAAEITSAVASWWMVVRYQIGDERGAS